MYKIKLKNNKIFDCGKESTIFEAAKNNKINLEHSCLSARCKSCMVKVVSGNTKNNEDEMVLSDEERRQNFVLSCNAKPLSDLELDIEDLGTIILYEKKIIPSKIDLIKKLNKDVVKLVLRIPPNSNFKYNSGQFVNLTVGNIKRSYSIANFSNHNNKLEFFIKNYSNGKMSDYIFNRAKINDLLRIEGPMGTFFLRDSELSNIIFLATGTGIAPIKSILEEINNSFHKYENKIFWLFVGVRYEKDLVWEPIFDKLNINYFPILSRQGKGLTKQKEYVQNAVLNHGIDLANSQVYACGSNNMIYSAKELLINNNLNELNFFSDAFVQSN